VDQLPAWLAEWVAAEATATQTPADLAAMLSLSICGAGLAGKYKANVRDRWWETLNIFTVTALPSGDRKSAVFRDALAPVLEFEQAEQIRLAPIIAELQSEHRTLEAALKNLKGKAAKETNSDDKQHLRHEVKQAARELLAHVVPEPPMFFCDDVTPEKLGNLLHRHGGRMLQAAPEGTAFEICKGRYSETANFDVYLKGHAGDPLRSGRISREGENVNNPALSVALAVQPDVIRGLAADTSMRGLGFLARFLYAMPVSKVGRREIRPVPVPDKVVAAYRHNVTAIWKLPANVGDDGKETPHLLTFSPLADDALRDFEVLLEPQLAPDGPLCHLAGWANKLAGAIARLSGILHVAKAIGGGGLIPSVLSDTTVNAAIAIGRDYLLPHAIAAFAVMGGDPQLDDAQRVIRWLEKNELNEKMKGGGIPETVSKNAIHKNVFGGTRSVSELDGVINLLVGHGYLRGVDPVPYQGRGRKPGARFLVNPLIATAETGQIASFNHLIHKNGDLADESDGHGDSWEHPLDKLKNGNSFNSKTL